MKKFKTITFDEFLDMAQDAGFVELTGDEISEILEELGYPQEKPSEEETEEIEDMEEVALEAVELFARFVARVYARVADTINSVTPEGKSNDSLALAVTTELVRRLS